MSAKADKRLAQKKEKRLKYDNILPEKKVPLDIEHKAVKKTNHQEIGKTSKTLYSQLNTFQKSQESIIHLKMSWCITKSDTDGSWSWNESRNWTANEWTNNIEKKLNDFTKLTWKEILYDLTTPCKTGAMVPLCHPQEIMSLRPEARKRWSSLNLDQYDTAFRFRVGGKKRIWGFRLQGHFYLIWWEREHKIYPIY